MKNCVVEDWLYADNISLKQQTVVLSALRGCDGQSRHDLSKKLARKIRCTVLKNAATSSTEFMQDLMTLDEVRDFAKDCDKYPVHYYIHVIHCCEIIGYKHNYENTRKWFSDAYRIMVDALHLRTETEKECDYRLRDGVN
ncbi:MAG: hypothetical protein FWE16_04460 [Firmicutes bacterium]|nr:hypothetical protein [Bacillota bacterium]